MQLVFEQIRTGGDRNFGYLLGDRDAKQAVLIDPSFSPDVLVQRAADQGLAVVAVINTHGHSDHVNGNARVAELTGAPIAAHPRAADAPAIPLTGGTAFPVGRLRLETLHVPGHAEDHLVVYESNHGIVVTGDLLFVGKVGGTTNAADARVEWDSLQRLLAAVPDDATIWPGHDYGVRPSSTIGMEKMTNPFLLCDGVDAFLRLKDEWPAFKKKHGLK